MWVKLVSALTAAVPGLDATMAFDLRIGLDLTVSGSPLGPSLLACGLIIGTGGETQLVDLGVREQ